MAETSMTWRTGRPAATAPQASAGQPTRPLHRLWLAGGGLCLLLGTLGIVVPLLPTVDFYVMAAWCFSRGSRRWEQWLLNHPRIGPLVRDWRADRSVPLRAKWLATLSMTASCLWAAQAMPARIAWVPALCCLLVAAYLWTRPTRRPAPPAADGAVLAPPPSTTTTTTTD
jgi:uncharacterized membrane protein YbaN (DUF454 family)